jgi:hypothetical protein
MPSALRLNQTRARNAEAFRVISNVTSAIACHGQNSLTSDGEREM